MCSWLVVNKLTLNIEKTNYSIFRPRQKTIPFHPNIKIINTDLARAKSEASVSILMIQAIKFRLVT